MMPFSLFLALKYLRPKRSVLSVVTLLSVLGVLLGVAILVIVTSVMTGFDNMWREKILSFKPHLTIYSRYGLIQGGESLAEKLAQVEGVVTASPAIETLVMMQKDERNAAPYVIGLDPDQATSLNTLSLNMAVGAFDLEGDSVVMGIDLARQLALDVGDTVLMYSSRTVRQSDEMYLPEELTVTGIYDMGMRDYDAGFAVVSLDTARRLEGVEDEAGSIYIRLEDPFLFESVGQRVAAAAGPAHVVKSWKDIDRLLFDALSHEKSMMSVLLGFITIVAMFCVANTLIIVTVQKTNEIGLLKALGFSSFQVMMAFLWYGWIQCFAGVALGMATGVLVLKNLKWIVLCLAKLDTEVFPKGIYGLDGIPYAYSVEDLVRIAIFVLVFCTMASLYPARRAAALDPVRALRHE